MILYGLVENGILHRLEVETLFQLKDFQTHVSLTNKPVYIEIVANQFTDSSIILICDEEFLLKNRLVTCITSKGILLHGNVIIASCLGEDIIGLTNKQFKIVCNELILVRRKCQ